MRAARAPENRFTARLRVRLLTRFGLVGIAATGLYAALAIIFAELDWIGFTPVEASLAAYAGAALFSYLAHRSITFISNGSHRSEGPRFVLLTAAGLAIAYIAPAVLTGGFSLHPGFAILVTCILVPAVNFFVLDRWVFTDRKSDQ
ncbi:GtrA family protein [Aminobacter anthyllidis]|uniref:GtrA family protein n=1 Tax=Aminobacter anthyllidis TaxID=1035067 RepID=A0A9X1ACF8_9HYPH|nr:GtrA family protein [Aminobacter anthyllidis]MBT1157283.1 GtrA family protein [Aminobacter anthyllidis]